MMNENYVKRELDEKFDAVHEKLDLILEQIKKINGRVGKLESWRSLLAGSWGIFIVFVIPLITYIFVTTFTSIEKKISDHIVQTK